jgi:uncharacterized membrane protein (UPF0127 family)
MTWPKNISIIIIAIVIGGLLAFLTYIQSLNINQQYFILNNKPLHLEIASSPEKHYQGLSNRSALCSECGMLFIFPVPENKTFVMRQMQFPLDIVWINQQTVVGISRNLPPEQVEPYTPYPSPGPVELVLELNAGTAEKYGLQVGEKFSLSRQ